MTRTMIPAARGPRIAPKAPSVDEALFALAVRLGDDGLVLGHRLSEWCGHAPMLEEDLALPNMGLDLLGQARALYTLAGEIEGEGRTEDDFAYHRDERAFRNCLLTERPNGDFAHTMLRQLIFAAHAAPFWQATEASSDPRLAGIAAKASKEMRYHVRHAAEWVIRMGDGTDESATRMAAAAAALAPYADELFETDAATEVLIAAGVIPSAQTIRPEYERTMDAVFAEACLTRPTPHFAQSGGRRGIHTEDLGHLLASLQYLARAHPGAAW